MAGVSGAVGGYVACASVAPSLDCASQYVILQERLTYSVLSCQRFATHDRQGEVDSQYPIVTV